jgi:O-antigen/teichoic acid export membrane protein
MRGNKVVTNASWIITCKIIQSVLAFVIGLLTARYLGPSNYGLVNYAASTVAFVAPLMYLGFNSTLVQELINDPNAEGEILGTAIGTSIGSAVFCIFGVNAFVAIANAGEADTAIVCALYSTLLIFQAIDLIQYWFQAKLMSKYTSIAMLVAYFIVSAYKVFLLVTQKGVYWFALSTSIEYMLIALFLIVVFKRISHIKLTYSKTRAKNMLKRSSFFILSNMMITVFTQTDRMMLKIMLDDEATGHYSAAAALSVMTSFVFAAIVDSVRPVILESKKTNEEQFELNVKRAYCVVIFLSLAQSIGMTVLARPVVLLTYGEQYYQAIGALRLVVWYTTFSYIGAVRSVWILANGLQKYLWAINLSGALANVALNAALIPIMGISGAAIASIITQFFTNVITGYIIPSFRPNNRLLLKSISPRLAWDMIKKIV